MEREISYCSTNTYNTLNSLTENTKDFWFVCHGMGQLSERFIKYFDVLDINENYIIAPQAPSKYYLSNKYEKVGTSWLTKLHTQKETENVMRYFDSILENENIREDISMNFLGYSQGVSVVTRYIARRQLHFNRLILFAGAIPSELKKENFNFLPNEYSVTFIYGTEDEFLNPAKIQAQTDKLNDLFPGHYQIVEFTGKHKFDISTVVKTI